MSAVMPAPRRPADNPFASHRIDGLRYRRPGLSLAMLGRRLETLGGRAAVVGPRGSGKTTLVEGLAARSRGPVARVVVPDSPRQPWLAASFQLPRPITPEHAVFVDGAERLGALGFRRLLHATRAARSVVVTLHEPRSLPTLITCRTDPALLAELVRELAPADAPDLEPRLGDLHRRHRGNLRECFRELYDLYAGRAHVVARSKVCTF